MPILNQTFVNKVKKEEHKDKRYADDLIKRLCIRVQGNTKNWIVAYRFNGKQCKHKIGSIYEISADKARQEAEDMLRMIDREQKDPNRERKAPDKNITIAELCEIYMLEGTSHKKESTLQIDRGRIDKHIKPLIGDIRVKDLNTGDIEKMMIDIMKGNKISLTAKSDKPRGVSRVTGGKEASNRTIQLLSAILNFAIRREIIDKNPSSLVKRPKTGKKEVFLDKDEIKVLGQALRDKQHADKKLAIQATKLLLLTGCRRDEVLSLKWDYVDMQNQCFRFPDTKTGKQIRPFGKSALVLLEQIKKDNKSKWVFPATRGEGYYIGLPKAFAKIYSSKPTDKEGKPIKDAKPYLEKEGLSLHSLRHSFASIANSLDFNEFTIAGLLGHRLRGVTSRYSHNVDKSLILSADTVSKHIAEALNGEKA